jgi:arabinose-5-phosphate isomerase
MNYYSLIEKEIESLKNLPIDKIEELVDFIFSNSKGVKIITSGMGKAGQMAHSLSTTLSSTGTPSYFLHPSEAQHGDLGIVQSGDIIITFSNSGKTREIIELIELIKNLNYNNPIISIVGQSSDFLQNNCELILEYGPVEEICPLELTPTTSTTCMSVISDLIVVGLIEKKKFTKKQYSKLHHGGYLGHQSRK